MTTKASLIDLNGNEMILDADGDTTITADTDDQIDFKVGGTDRLSLKSDGKLSVTEINHISSGTLEIGNGDEKQIFDATEQSIEFQTADSERMRITSDGKVGIGETSPDSLLHIKGGAPVFTMESNTNSSSRTWDFATERVAGGDLSLRVGTSLGGTPSVTAMYFDSSGNVAMGTTSFISNAALTVDGGDMMVQGTNNSAGISDLLAGYTRGDYGVFYSTANHIYFSVGSSYVGYISGSSGQYNVSDERLKENVATLTGTLDKVKQLRGVSHTWKDTEQKGTDTNIGMIAQEVETVYPELVGDGGLPNDNEGNAPYKSVNYAHLTSVLVEAVKELSTKLDAAEARITTLEGGE